MAKTIWKILLMKVENICVDNILTQGLATDRLYNCVCVCPYEVEDGNTVVLIYLPCSQLHFGFSCPKYFSLVYFLRFPLKYCIQVHISYLHIYDNSLEYLYFFHLFTYNLCVQLHRAYQIKKENRNLSMFLWTSWRFANLSLSL